AFALRLEAVEDPLRDLEGLVVAALRLGFDARAKEVRGARFDVLYHQLELLEAPIRLLRRLVRLAVRRATRLRLSRALVRAREFVDLLSGPTDVAPESVDDAIELSLEVVAFLDQARRLSARARSIWTHSHGTAITTNVGERATTRQPSCCARAATGS